MGSEGNKTQTFEDLRVGILIRAHLISFLSFAFLLIQLNQLNIASPLRRWKIRFPINFPPRRFYLVGGNNFRLAWIIFLALLFHAIQDAGLWEYLYFFPFLKGYWVYRKIFLL